MQLPKIKQVSPQDVAENGMHLMGYKYKVESYTGTFFVFSRLQALKVCIKEFLRYIGIRFINKWVCKHDWELVSNWFETTSDKWGVRHRVVSVFVCKKCGKTKEEVCEPK